MHEDRDATEEHAKPKKKASKAEMLEAEQRCICYRCPSYIGETKKGFCAKGGSEKIKRELGCICPGCAMKERLMLKNLYYCIYGAESEQPEADRFDTGY